MFTKTISVCAHTCTFLIALQDAGTITAEQGTPDAKLLARELVQEAFARGSADNISCVVIRFSAS